MNKSASWIWVCAACAMTAFATPAISQSPAGTGGGAGGESGHQCHACATTQSPDVARNAPALSRVYCSRRPTVIRIS
jgi:hypothetical protein